MYFGVYGIASVPLTLLRTQYVQRERRLEERAGWNGDIPRRSLGTQKEITFLIKSLSPQLPELVRSQDFFPKKYATKSRGC